MTAYYNKYVTKEALKQSGKGEDGIHVYKVRRPKADEEVRGYENLAEAFYKPTPTERAEVKDGV